MSDAVLLVGHGSVEKAEDIPAFLANIRHGRPTPPAIVEEVTRRFLAIGGSPLLGISQAQAAALATRLGVRVEVGMRLFTPYARDVVRTLAAEGVTRLVSLPLAPFSTHLYNPLVAEACAANGITCLPVGPWGEEPALVEAFAETVREAHADGAHVVFTAHSLPLRVLSAGDRYEHEVRSTMEAVARRVGCARYSVAFQSQGMDGGEWLGPDLPTTMARLVREGDEAVLFSAIGFLADHTEVLFDLDVEARGQAEALGLRYHRAASLNARSSFVDALEALARRALTGAAGAA
ncbi:MAG: ferrochelatase [Myxococcales bacterium]|nr:ferrochelatase [Myxococcales bacterium]